MLIFGANVRYLRTFAPKYFKRCLKLSINIIDWHVEINKLKALKEKHEASHTTGAINEYLEDNGGFKRAFELFDGVEGFLSVIKAAGFSRQYRSDLRKKWNKKFNRPVRE